MVSTEFKAKLVRVGKSQGIIIPKKTAAMDGLLLSPRGIYRVTIEKVGDMPETEPFIYFFRLPKPFSPGHAADDNAAIEA